MEIGDTDFMKIRRWVINTIATGGNQPIRFPATRVLGKQFNVSQPTAQRVIKSLIEEGLLIPCRTGGTISRPCSIGNTEHLKIFGLVEYQGKQAFDTLYFELIRHAVAHELLRRSISCSTKTLYLETPSHLERQTREENLSGVVLLGSEPHTAEYARQLRTHGTPVASFMHRFDGISSFYNPTQDRTRNTLEALFRDGKTRVLILGWPDRPDFSEPICAGIQEACDNTDTPRGRVVFLDRPFAETKEKIKEMLEFGMKFDAVIINNFLRDTFELLREHLNENGTSYFVDRSAVFDELHFTGYMFYYDLESAAKSLADDLFRQISDPASPPVYEKIPYRLVRYREGVPQEPVH